MIRRAPPARMDTAGPESSARDLFWGPPPGARRTPSGPAHSRKVLHEWCQSCTVLDRDGQNWPRAAKSEPARLHSRRGNSGCGQPVTAGRAKAWRPGWGRESPATRSSVSATWRLPACETTDGRRVDIGADVLAPLGLRDAGAFGVRSRPTNATGIPGPGGRGPLVARRQRVPPLASPGLGDEARQLRPAPAARASPHDVAEGFFYELLRTRQGSYQGRMRGGRMAPSADAPRTPPAPLPLPLVPRPASAAPLAPQTREPARVPPPGRGHAGTASAALGKRACLKARSQAQAPQARCPRGTPSPPAAQAASTLSASVVVDNRLQLRLEVAQRGRHPLGAGTNVRPHGVGQFRHLPPAGMAPDQW